MMNSARAWRFMAAVMVRNYVCACVDIVAGKIMCLISFREYVKFSLDWMLWNQERQLEEMFGNYQV